MATDLLGSMATIPSVVYNWADHCYDFDHVSQRAIRESDALEASERRRIDHEHQQMLKRVAQEAQQLLVEQRAAVKRAAEEKLQAEANAKRLKAEGTFNAAVSTAVDALAAAQQTDKARTEAAAAAAAGTAAIRDTPTTCVVKEEAPVAGGGFFDPSVQQRQAALIPTGSPAVSDVPPFLLHCTLFYPVFAPFYSAFAPLLLYFHSILLRFYSGFTVCSN